MNLQVKTHRSHKSGAWTAALTEHPRLWGPRAYLQALAKAKPAADKEIRDDKSLLAVGVTRAVEGVAPEKIKPFIQEANMNDVCGKKFASHAHEVNIQLMIRII